MCAGFLKIQSSLFLNLAGFSTVSALSSVMKAFDEL